MVLSPACTGYCCTTVAAIMPVESVRYSVTCAASSVSSRTPYALPGRSTSGAETSRACAAKTGAAARHRANTSKKAQIRRMNK